MINPTLDELSSLFNANEGPVITAIIRSKKLLLPSDSMPNNTPQDIQVLLDIKVLNSLSWFAGHFPDQPVLPGVVQVDWAGQFALFLFDELGPFRKLTNVKFSNMILPNTQLQLTLDYAAEKCQVGFRYANQDTIYSSGTMVFQIK